VVTTNIKEKKMKKLIFLTLFVVFTTALPATALGWMDFHFWDKSSATMKRDLLREIENFTINTCEDIQNTMSIMNKMKKLVPLNKKDNTFIREKMLILKKKGDNVKSLKEQVILINEDLIRKAGEHKAYLLWHMKVCTEFHLNNPSEQMDTDKLILEVKTLHKKLKAYLLWFKETNFKKQQENPRQNDGDSFLYLYLYFKKNLL